MGQGYTWNLLLFIRNASAFLLPRRLSGGQALSINQGIANHTPGAQANGHLALFAQMANFPCMLLLFC
jgi:hypothetical protein